MNGTNHLFHPVPPRPESEAGRHDPGKREADRQEKKRERERLRDLDAALEDDEKHRGRESDEQAYDSGQEKHLATLKNRMDSSVTRVVMNRQACRKVVIVIMPKTYSTS